MFVGSGANGKSTLLELLETFIGKQNASHVTLQALCDHRFAAAELCLKLINTCADIPHKNLFKTGTFKELTGGDMIQAERKFKSFFYFRNYAKLLFSCNAVPESTDDSLAWFRRWIIIECPNQFTGDKEKPRIIDSLTTPQELSGTLNWALEGLTRLLNKKRFTNQLEIAQQRQNHIEQSNSCQA